MQFDTERYPVVDIKFKVFGSLGIMAREVEQQQLSSLLNTVPPDSPAYWMLIRSIYENSSITSKDTMLKLVDQLLQKTLNPAPDPLIAIEQQKLEVLAKDKSMSLKIELGRANTERARVMIENEMLPYNKAKAEAKAILDVANAESKELGTQIDEYSAIVDIFKSKGEQDSGQRDANVLRESNGNVPNQGMGNVR